MVDMEVNTFSYVRRRERVYWREDPRTGVGGQQGVCVVAGGVTDEAESFPGDYLRGCASGGGHN